MKHKQPSATYWYYGLAIIAFASTTVNAQKSYSPYVTQDYPHRVYWGDTHVHTNISLDSYLFDNGIGADEAYRFAKGDTVTATGGRKTRLRRPLDFLVVADHAENLGVLAGLWTSDPALLKTEFGRRLYKKFQAYKETLRNMTYGDPSVDAEFVDALYKNNDEYSRSVWSKVIADADKYNAPGLFTAFAGYEWTSLEYGPSPIEGGG